MHFVTGELCLVVPTNNEAINATREDQEQLEVKTAAHNVVMMDCDARGWDILAGHGVTFFFITTSPFSLGGWVVPFMQ